MRRIAVVSLACHLCLCMVATQAADVRIAAARPGVWVEGEGVLVVLAVKNGKRVYGVVAETREGSHAVFPAEMETEIPEARLGRPSRLIVMIVDDTPGDEAPRRLVMRVQGIKPLIRRDR